MCGIVGSFGTGLASDIVRQMLKTQHHRGPDHTGIYESLSGLATLGHNRLKIIDLSDQAKQPMEDESGRFGVKRYAHAPEYYHECEAIRLLD